MKRRRFHSSTLAALTSPLLVLLETDTVVRWQAIVRQRCCCRGKARETPALTSPPWKVRQNWFIPQAFQVFPWTLDTLIGRFLQKAGGWTLSKRFQLEFNWIHPSIGKILQNIVSAGKVPLDAGVLEYCRHFPETPMSIAKRQGNLFTRAISTIISSKVEDARETFLWNET